MEYTYVIILIIFGAVIFWSLHQWRCSNNKMMIIKDEALEASTRLESSVSQLSESRDKIASLEDELKNAHAIRQDSEIKLQLAQQENNLLKKQMDDWERTKREHLDAAKASMLEASKQLSNKLLDDHKRENTAHKEEADKRVKKTTEELHKQFKDVFSSMHSLHDQVKDSKKTIEIVERSLLNPGGAGNLSEITLSNIFRASSLTEERDYTLQHTINETEESGKLRPDAIVFLPGNNLMVIDSKASKFFTEIGAAEHANNDDLAKKLEKQLKNSMAGHLKDLISRDYQSAITIEAQHKDGTEQINFVTMFMFLPSDAALEKMRNLAPDLIDKALQNRIIPASPSTLMNALWQANYLISNAKQQENVKHIVALVQEMLSSVATLNDHSEKVGKSLKSSLDHYNKFAGSFNRTFLSKIRKLEAASITTVSGKALHQLPRYHISDYNKTVGIEASEDESIASINKEEKKLRAKEIPAA